jgi:hypothetical protein
MATSGRAAYRHETGTEEIKSFGSRARRAPVFRKPARELKHASGRSAGPAERVPWNWMALLGD